MSTELKCLGVVIISFVVAAGLSLIISIFLSNNIILASTCWVFIWAFSILLGSKVLDIIEETQNEV